MNAGYSAHTQSGCRSIVGPAPATADCADAAAGKPVHGSESERFRLAVIPAETRENARITSNSLLGVDAEPVLCRAGAPCKCDVGSGVCFFGQLNGTSISSRICVQGEAKQANDSLMLAGRI